MKAILAGATLSSFLLLTVLGAAAQNTSQPEPVAKSTASSSEPTIEELYLQNVAMRIVHEQAIDLSRDSKLLALASIREMIDSGTVAKNSVVALDILGYLANEGTGHVAMEDNRLINDFPEVRREACNLLGRMGGEQADAILMQVMTEDREPMVLSEAAYALGQIGLNQGGRASERIASAVMRIEAQKPDNNLAFASLLAFEKLARKNKGLNDPAAFRAIIAISRGPYVHAVKQKALQVLDGLKQYG